MLTNFLVLVCFVMCATTKASLNARAWQSVSGVPSQSDFPESSLLNSRPNTAIAFTGGGSRAYIASIGHLAGLNKLGLLKNVRYIGGISGGAWATSTFTFAQTVSNDDVLLGDVIPPESISRDGLKNMDSNCARSLASANVTLIALKAYHDKVVTSVSDAWAYAISKTYLEPVGVSPGVRFSWDANTVTDIKKRNPSLANEKFYLPTKPERPYSIIGSALVGPADGAPYNAKNQNYTLTEITPLYIGQMRVLDVKYKYSMGLTHTRRIGGAIEPFAFAQKGSAPLLGLSSNKQNDILRVPEPTQIFDLMAGAGASSYAPGSLVESLHPEDLSTALGLKFDYWSPADRIPSTETTLFADGGCFENIPLISFLQRRVAKIVLFFVSSTPLAPSSKYNPYTDVYTGDEISNTLTAFFGVLESSQANWENRSFEYEMNQVFAREDYAPVVAALQSAQAKGNGILATFNLTTVENTWWGIPAGLHVEITFSYLGRLSQWEAKLSPDMQNLVIPDEMAEDLSVDIDEGPFRKFPHYATLGGEINAERANLLADLTGWQVTQNADLFRHMLS